VDREIGFKVPFWYRPNREAGYGIKTVLEELHLLGFRHPNGPRKAPAPGSFHEKKIRELWRLLNEAGALKDSSEKALQAFIRRQTMGAQMMPQWLTAEQANKLMEGLKAWHSRARREAAPLSRGTSVASPEAEQSVV
jgi:hypothetical protein